MSIRKMSLGDLVSAAPIERAKGQDLPVLSMTRASGLVPQERVFNKSVAGRDLTNYKVVKPHQLVVGIHVDEGALGVSKLEDHGIVSPAYAIWNLRDADRVDPIYLDRFIRSPRAIDYFVAHYRQTAHRRGKLTQEQFLALEVPLPPLTEQKRIAAILDAADSLRAKRRESIAQLDSLLQSTFLDMFGDPVTNPMGWDVGRLEDWLENIDSGWSPKCLERKAQRSEWGVLKLGAVTWCEFDEEEHKALPASIEPRPALEVRKGDLLFTRKNTYELVAAVAYVFNVRPGLMLPDLIFRLKLKPSAEVESKFLWQLLAEPHQRKSIQKLAGGSAGSMPNISKTKLKSVDLIRPPLKLQHRFATIVESIEGQKARMRAHLAELDTLVASLQSRAFSGAL